MVLSLRERKGKEREKSEGGQVEGREERARAQKRRLSPCQFHCGGVDQENRDYGYVVCNFKMFSGM